MSLLPSMVTLSKTDSQLDNSQSSRPIEHNAYKVYVDKTNVGILLSEIDPGSLLLPATVAFAVVYRRRLCKLLLQIAASLVRLVL